MFDFGLGSLVVQITADTIGLQKGLDDAQKQITDTAREIRKVGREVFHLGAILTAFGTGVFLLLKKAIDTTVDALGNSAYQDAVSALDDNVQSLSFTIGEMLLPVATDLTRAISNLVAWFLQLPEPIQRISIFGIALAAGLMLVIGTFGLLAGSILQIIGLFGVLTGTTGLGGLVAGLSALAAPIAFVIVALGALWIAWQTNFGNIQKHAQEVLEGLTRVFTGIVQVIAGLMNVVVGIKDMNWDKISFGLTQIALGVATIVQGLLQALVFGIIGFLADILKGSVTWTFQLTSKLLDVFFDFGISVVDVFFTIASSLTKTMQAAFNNVIGIINSVISRINQFLGHEVFKQLGTVNVAAEFSTARQSALAQLSQGRAEFTAGQNAALSIINNFDFSSAFFSDSDALNNMVTLVSKSVADELKRVNQASR